MDPTLLLEGLVMGFSIAAPVGRFYRDRCGIEQVPKQTSLVLWPRVLNRSRMRHIDLISG